MKSIKKRISKGRSNSFDEFISGSRGYEQGVQRVDIDYGQRGGVTVVFSISMKGD